MTCLEVRDLLPELSIGVLPESERERLGRHLQWCAGLVIVATRFRLIPLDVHREIFPAEWLQF